MRIIPFNPAEHEKLWSDFIVNCPQASVYHTRAWAEVIKNTFNFKERSLACFDDSGKIRAALPLWQVNRNVMVNSPLRDRADLLSSIPEGKESIFRQLQAIDCDLVLKDWNQDIPSGEFILQDYWVTSVLDLTPGKDVVWNKVDKSVWRNIKKAEECGVKIEQVANEQKMKEFYYLFKKTRKRLGVPIYPFLLFKNMLRYLKSDAMRLYIGYLNGRPISGIIILDSPATSIYAYGASDYKYQAIRANDSVFWKAIEDSIDLKKRSFDFGADSPGQINLLRYKNKWGSYQRQLRTLYKGKKKIDFTKNDFSSARYNLHRCILSLFPEWALVLMGSFMVKRHG